MPPQAIVGLCQPVAVPPFVMPHPPGGPRAPVLPRPPRHP
jgi:hypothetical protein